MLPNISRSQSDNEIGQLIEYNIRNMLLEELYTNEVQKPFPDPYLKNQTEHISGLVVYCSIQFDFMASWWLSKYIKVKLQTTCFYLMLHAFLAWIWRKTFLLLYSINWPSFHFLVAITSWDIQQYVYCNCLLTRLWCHKF